MRPAPWMAGLVLLLGSACSEDRDPPATGSSTSTGTTDTTDGSSTSTTGADETTGPMWPTPLDDDLLTCVRTCELPSDCCPPNTAGSCPASTYPYNYACYEGICVFPPCEGDADCPGDGEVCREVGGLPSCVLPCEDDAPCTAASSDQTCSATADDGSRYCFAHCTNPGVFCGIAGCDEASGVCVCSSVGQCQSGWDCV
ncbi:MAG: hypothetical protein KDK70_12325 [Myxococcales bacterium]|nr:hypothetical protein [Myxococcales bacterium]